MFVYDSFKAPRSGRGDGTSATWVLEEWGEQIAPTLPKIQCWLCFYAMIHMWQGSLGYMLGRFLWERIQLTQGVFYPSLCLFTLNTLLSNYIWWQSQSWWQFRGKTQKGNSMMRLSQQYMFIHHCTPFMSSSHCMTLLGRFKHHSLNPFLFPCGWSSGHSKSRADWCWWTWLGPVDKEKVLGVIPFRELWILKRFTWGLSL